MSVATWSLDRTRAWDRIGLRLPWLALLPLALIPVLGGDAGRLNTLLFATELLLLVAGVRRPIWIAGALLMSEMTAANYIHELGGAQISNRLLLTLASIPVLLPHITARADIGPRAKATAGLAIVFILIATASNMAYAQEGYVLTFLRYAGVGLYLLLLIPITIRDHEDLRDLGVLLIGIAALSALAGAFQHFAAGHGTPLWQVIPHAGAPGETFTSWEERAVGLSENPILAGNVLMMAGLFLLGALLMAPMPVSAKRVFACALLLMALTAYFTFTRSWAIAIAPALVLAALLYRGQYKKEFWLLIIVLAGGIYYWSEMKANRYTADASNDGGSAAARPVLWSVGLSIAYDHPFLGVGHDAFLTLSPEYAKTVDQDVFDGPGAKDVIGKYTPHNDLLNIWLSFGFFALLVYVLLTLAIGRNFLETYMTAADPLLRGLALGGLAAMVGFQVNSFFHNFFDSTLTYWILGGFSLVLLKLAPREPATSEPETIAPPSALVLVRNERGEWEPCAV